MSIGAKPWEGGGAASVPDASETTKGKIRIATSAEAASGLDDLTAMTPLTVKERIDAALAGGVEYKGTFNATTGLPSLANAEQGDLYRIATGGTIYGQTWALNDNLLINADMGGVIDNAKIDKIDNTDAVSSVNALTGAVVLDGGNISADYTATSYIASSANINGHLEGIDDEFLLTATLADPAFTGTPTAPTATQGDNSTQIATTAYVDTAVAGAGGISSVVEDTTPQLGGDLDVNGQTITSASNGDVTIDPNGTGDVVVGADLMPDANATHYIGDENTRFVSAYTNVNGAIQFKAKNDQGASITKGQAVYIKGVSGTVPTVGLARANSALTMPAFGLALTDANDQAEVQVVTFGNLTDYNTTTYSLSANQTVYVSSATAGALTNTAPTGESNLIQNIGRVVRADASAGIIKVGGAGRSNATPNLDQDKIFVGNASNQAVSTALSAINLSSFNDDLTSTYQPLDAGLTSISGLTTSADKMIYTTASDTYAVTPISAAGRSFVSANDAGAQRSALGLGTAATSDSSDFQPTDAGLTSISGLTTAANKMIYTTGSDTYAVTDLTSAGRALLDDADAAAQRTTLGLGTAATSDSSDFLASTAAVGDLSDVTITSVSNGQVLSYNSTSGDWENTTPTSGGATDLDGLSDVTITSATGGDLLQNNGSGQFVNVAKSSIDVGTFNDDGTYQASDAGLTSIAGLTTAADKMIYTTGSDTYAVTDLTSAGRALLDDADATAQRTTLGLGTAATSDSGDFQPIDAGLTSISGLTTAADKMIYTTASDTYAVTDLTSAGRALLDDADASAQRTTLGLGTAATSASSDFLASTAGLNNLSDVSFTAGAGIDNYVLTYDHSTTSWGAEAAAGGGGGFTYSAVSTATTAQADYHYSVTGTTTITLPAASGVTAGKQVRVKVMGTDTVTVSRSSTDTIDGQTSISMAVQYQSLTFVSNGSNGWEIV